MPIIEYKKGQAFTVSLWQEKKGECPTREFLNTLKVQYPLYFEDMVELIERTAEVGPPKYNNKKCKPLGEGIFEFKVSDARILWFYSRRERKIIICTHGFTKKQDKTPAEEKTRAQMIRAKYEEEYDES